MSKPCASRQNDGMRWRRVAVVAGILVAAGGIGAASLGLFAYNEVTKIDRSEPEVVTDEYLRAVLVRKDKIGADLYSCDDKTKLAPLVALRDDLDKRERDFQVTITVGWGSYTRNQDALSTDLTITAMSGGTTQGRQTETWKFTLVNDDGWYVCGAEKQAKPGPSPTPTTTH